MAVGNMRKMSTHVDAHVGDQVQYVLNLSEDASVLKSQENRSAKVFVIHVLQRLLKRPNVLFALNSVVRILARVETRSGRRNTITSLTLFTWRLLVQ
jgi:hypothetical protein